MVESEAVRTEVRSALEAAYSRLRDYRDTPPTLLGVHIYGYDGTISIMANFDDDESAQAAMMEEFKGGTWASFEIAEVGDWVSNGGPLTFSNFQGDDENSCYEAIYDWILECVKDHLSHVPKTSWRPHRVVFEEFPVINTGEAWNCPGGLALPPRPPVSTELFGILGFQGPELNGTCVYRLPTYNNVRKYCSLYIGRNTTPKPEGMPLLDQWPADSKAELHQSDCKRLGPLAMISGLEGVFGLLSEHPSAAAIRSWLAPYCEFLPVRDREGNAWEVVHALHVGDSLLAPIKSQFQYLSHPTEGEKPWSILYHHFLPEKLSEVTVPVFKLSELNTAGPYFMTREGLPNFIDLCEEAEARGIELELVWCDDLPFLFAQLQEFRRIADARIQRIMGTTDIAPVNIECLGSAQVKYWELARTTEHPEDLRDRIGSLCAGLPTALQSIKHMEATGTGELAIYGPSI